MRSAQYRQYHLSIVLKRFEQQKTPLDVFLSHYFRNNKALGSKDRLYISDAVYRYIRWKNLYLHLGLDPSCEPPSSDGSLPHFIRLGTPSSLYHRLVEIYGALKTEEICRINNTRAPFTIRVNTLKISRDELLARWNGLYLVTPCTSSPQGIYFHEKINLYTLPEFKEGLLEVQDEGSQLVAALVRAEPKQKILDYCAGSGGKTLAIAPLLKNTGQIYLHDIRPLALQKAKTRLRRAGIQNIQFSIPHSKMDWVVVDVPCSGTGTLRRNPDLKWKFEQMDLKKLVSEQREIFKKALSFLSRSGKIVYMTCSILPEENERQVSYFQKEFGLQVVETFQSLPTQDGMDGFFGVSFAFV